MQSADSGKAAMLSNSAPYSVTGCRATTDEDEHFVYDIAL
jgi:hypothetical protein